MFFLFLGVFVATFILTNPTAIGIYQWKAFPALLSQNTHIFAWSGNSAMNMRRSAQMC